MMERSLCLQCGDEKAELGSEETYGGHHTGPGEMMAT